jgi:hypothetical protein
MALDDSLIVSNHQELGLESYELRHGSGFILFRDNKSIALAFEHSDRLGDVCHQ